VIPRDKPRPCYRDRDNGVRFIKDAHRPDCVEVDCKGCQVCPERHHCTAKRNCSWHLDEGVLRCGRCLAGVRRDLRWIGDLSALVAVQALADGVNSRAANLAGPAADPRALAEWQVARKSYLRAFEERGRITEEQHLHALEALSADDDEHHPYAVLTRWQMMLSEDYGHELPRRLSTLGALGYLDRQLHRVANDEEQDFDLLRSELRDCRRHLESVLHNDTERDKGAPCPTCREARRAEWEAAERDGREVERKRLPRLERHYAHWCDDETCQRIHFADDGSDVWRCPRDASHWWTQNGYAELLQARRTSVASRTTAV
jgi:hypothetical protein